METKKWNQSYLVVDYFKESPVQRSSLLREWLTLSFRVMRPM